MAKLKMKLVSIYAPKGQSDAILNRLQQMAVMDIETAFSDEETSYLPKGYKYEDRDESFRAYERNEHTAEEALKILSERFPEKGGLLSFLKSPEALKLNEFYLDAAAENDMLTLAQSILDRERAIAEQKAEIMRQSAACEQLIPWSDLDVPLDFEGTAHTRAFIGTVTGSFTLEELSADIAERDPSVTAHCEIIYAGKDLTYIFVCTPVGDGEKAEKALRELGFARPITLTSILPREEIELKRKKIEECGADIEKSIGEIKALSKRRGELKLYADLCRAKSESYKTAGEIARTDSTVLIRGYIAERDVRFLTKNLEKDFTVVIETEDADEKLAPVKLKNNAFAAPAESITKMYSLPSSEDIDPTPLTGFFYYLLFGMMFSDAGYGLIMVIATAIALKKLKPSSPMRNTVKMFLYCGISTVCWGLFFGSFFGDSISVISETFFGRRITLPAVIDPMNGGATNMLILSLAIGMVQIIAGLGAKFVTCMKNGDKAAAFFDAGLWITTLVGVSVAAIGIFTVKTVTVVGAAITILSLIGLVLTQGRAYKNPILRLLMGVKSLYDITGYVSDLLSFSRLMALGLTTAAMGAVFNLLGTLLGNGIAGVCLMVVMFTLGHAISFLLNVLGAYVHTLRLQYVELFSKFYSGGGREFKSFSIKNKYVGIEGDIGEEN